MKNLLTFFGKTIAPAFLMLAIASLAFSQVTLRRAMDFDGDGKADYVIFRPDNNYWYILTSQNNVVIQPWGIANEDHLVPGDYDGDGKADLAVWRDTNGIWFVINSGTSTVSIAQFGVTGDEPVARDYDGDGKTDFAVVRRSNGAMLWYVLRSSDLGLSVAQFGLSTDYTAPGDYDGDGKFDLAVQRPGANPTDLSTFFINQTTAGFRAVPWGFANDFVVPGDYDGDGKTDIAVVREGATASDNLWWYIIKSSDGGPLFVPFGLTGTDYTAQGDYDGDGKTDLAVWRNSTGQFFVFNQVTLSLTAIPWGLPNDYPVANFDTH